MSGQELARRLILERMIPKYTATEAVSDSSMLSRRAVLLKGADKASSSLAPQFEVYNSRGQLVTDQRTIELVTQFMARNYNNIRSNDSSDLAQAAAVVGGGAVIGSSASLYSRRGFLEGLLYGGASGGIIGGATGCHGFSAGIAFNSGLITPVFALTFDNGVSVAYIPPATFAILAGFPLDAQKKADLFGVTCLDALIDQYSPVYDGTMFLGVTQVKYNEDGTLATKDGLPVLNEIARITDPSQPHFILEPGQDYLIWGPRIQSADNQLLAGTFSVMEGLQAADNLYQPNCDGILRPVYIVQGFKSHPDIGWRFVYELPDPASPRGATGKAELIKREVADILPLYINVKK